MTTNLTHWADVRNTSIQVAEAIHDVATDNRPAQDIWEEPSEDEMARVKAIAFAHEDEDDTLFWGATILTRGE